MVLAIAACDKLTETQAEPTSKLALTNATVLVPPHVVETDLVTPADFEDAAARSITKATYKTELIVLGFELARR